MKVNISEKVGTVTCFDVSPLALRHLASMLGALSRLKIRVQSLCGEVGSRRSDDIGLDTPTRSCNAETIRHRGSRRAVRRQAVCCVRKARNIVKICRRFPSLHKTCRRYG